MRRRPVESGETPLFSLDGGSGKGGGTYPTVTPPPSSYVGGGSRPTRRMQHHGSVQALHEDRRLEDMILKVAGKSPPWLANFLRAFAPLLTLTFKVANTLGPVVIKFYALLYKGYKMLPVNVIGMIYGLVMCFFGGFFHVTIAAVEAFNMTGGEKVWLCIHDLKEDIKILHHASKEDDMRDDDNDGIPDVKQASTSTPFREKLLTRKTALALRVVDPDRATNALTGVWQGYMGVLVVLKFRFAKVIALAVSIGNNLRPIVAKIFGPALAFVIPKEYHQWIAPMINYFCKFVAMTVAWWIQRFISTVQSAIKGGLLFARSLMCMISEVTPLKLDPDSSFLDELMGWTLAACGAYFQISINWDLPWTVDLLLWPAYLLETFLKWSITWMDVPAQPA
ncbi:unnamed protein product [Scytosiphon promiscuus]